MASVQPLSFASMLRRYRFGAGLTQEELAERAGLSVKSIGALECGARRTPRKDTVNLLANALGLTQVERALFETAARQRLAGSSETDIARGVRTTTSAAQRPDPPLVGRRQELLALERHLAGKGPPLALFAGEPGIGKSRLLEESAQQAATLGWTVIAGGCHRRSGQEPYAPFVSALTHFLFARPPAQQRLDLHGCAWLVRLLPELAEIAVVPTPSWSLAREQEQRLMCGAVARFLANVADVAGTLLILDDLQWAEGDALDLLAFLLREPHTRPLRIVGAYRDTDVGPRDPLPLLLGDLLREGLVACTNLPLLDRDAARDLLSALLLNGEGDYCSEQDGSWSRVDQVGAVLDRAGGLPLFLVSCVQELHMGSMGSIAHGTAGSAVPWSTTASIRQRVAVLPDAAQDVLAVAAVTGRTVSLPILLAAAKASGQDEVSILAGLDVACRARLLVEESGRRYVFSHDLIRETIDADLGGARRSVLHRHIADALEALPHAERHAAELAWHFREGDEPARALPYALQAGDQAEEMYALSDAERQYADAVELARTCGDAAHEASALERRAEVCYRLARFTEAVSDLDVAAGIYRRLGDWERLVWATTQRVKAGDSLGQVAESLARVEALATTLAAAAALWDKGGEASMNGPVSLAQHMQRASTILTPRTAARLYLCLTSRMVLLGRLDEVQWTSEQVASYAAAASAVQASEGGQERQRLRGMERPLVMQSLVLSFRAAALQAHGQLHEAEVILEDAVRLARECRDMDALGMALTTMADVYERKAELGKAQALLRELLTMAHEHDDVRYASDVEWRLGQLALVECD